ncbi:MAG: pyridoxamine 5'-phosphate oxidase [Arsenophonus sp.]|nr:MAG: pyridoxamine 5'-phosphate oxidase [Arsenophonus sp.]
MKKKISSININNIRREYIRGELRRNNLTQDPLKIFHRWLIDAYKSSIPDPSAMCVSTVDHFGQPYQRIVLLKYFDKNGLIFYTNFSSRKARHISLNNKVSALFPWNILDRQVLFIGNAEKIPFLKVKKYFYSRPKNNQISTLISKQSSIISNRSQLEKLFLKYKKKYKNKKIPYPYYWGGYRIKFNFVEFWQGRTKRLHDRFLYKKKNKSWIIYRLAP